MKFGVFDHMDVNSSVPLAQQYEERLKLIEAYDRSGFFCYHLAEHHSTPLGMAPNPSVFLSAVAQRTKRLRFGPMVWLSTRCLALARKERQRGRLRPRSRVSRRGAREETLSLRSIFQRVSMRRAACVMGVSTLI